MKLRSLLALVFLMGMLTFFLPLVRIQSPLLGTQEISGWDAVKPEDEKARGSDQGLIQSLEKLQRDILRKKIRESPPAVQQAKSLVVTLPLAYLALLLGSIFVLLNKAKWARVAAVLGVLSSVWSLVSVFWLSSGVKEVVAGAGGSRMPLLGRVTQAMAEKTSVSPEVGLYLLVVWIAGMLLGSFLLRKQ
jgi:hypothetical protein